MSQHVLVVGDDDPVIPLVNARLMTALLRNASGQSYQAADTWRS